VGICPPSKLRLMSHFSIKYAEMLKVLEEANYDGWISVELDSYPDPKKGAEISREFLSKFETIKTK
jgi:inosose dehydratase